MPGASSETPGKTWKTTVASKMIRPMATTNSGSDVAASSTTDEMRSNQPSLRRAAKAPSATPRNEPITPVTRTRMAELTSLGSTRLHTDWLLTRELPSLPSNRPEIHVQYWSKRPRFRCSWFSSARTRTGLAFRPRIAKAALPGSTSVATNTTTETRNRVSTPKASLRRTKRAIGFPSRTPAATVGGSATTATAGSASGTRGCPAPRGSAHHVVGSFRRAGPGTDGECELICAYFYRTGALQARQSWHARHQAR